LEDALFARLFDLLNGSRHPPLKLQIPFTSLDWLEAVYPVAVSSVSALPSLQWSRRDFVTRALEGLKELFVCCDGELYQK
jgi:hypothetical protein